MQRPSLPLLIAFAIAWMSTACARPPECELPFDTGPCRAAVPVFAYVDGTCVERTWGGCDGNANRFDTWQECVTTCELRQPAPEECPPDYERRSVCTRCGEAGGCSVNEVRCAKKCSGAECNGLSSEEGPLTCSEGVCQVAGCD